MLYFVIIVLSCALSITCLYQKTIYTNTEKVENRDSKEQENEMLENISKKYKDLKGEIND